MKIKHCEAKKIRNPAMIRGNNCVAYCSILKNVSNEFSKKFEVKNIKILEKNINFKEFISISIFGEFLDQLKTKFFDGSVFLSVYKFLET
jgi:hypothetical protein